MRYTYSILVALIFLLWSCTKEYGTTTPPSTPPVSNVFLKDMVMSNLPSPFYHFEYDTSGRIIRTSYSAGLRMYDVLYHENRISEMRNNTSFSKHTLQYLYNSTGLVERVNYLDDDGELYRRLFLTYNGHQVKKMEWEFKVSTGFFVDRTVTFVYRADGNLLEFTSHRFPFENQTDVLYTDHFEDYDTKINTDEFSVFYENNEHMLLFPGIVFQKNNPGKITRTGNGNNFILTYTYTYNSKNVPLTKKGDFIYTSGPNNGERFALNDTYSYY